MYYVLHIMYWFIVYILTVFYLIMYDYVYTVRVCLIVYLYFVWSILLFFLYPTFAFWSVSIVKKWMWRCVKSPFILQPQGGRCQVCQALTKPPTIVAHLYSQPSAMRPASIFSLGNVLLLFRRGLSPFTCTHSCVVTLRLVLTYRRCDVSSVFPLFSVVIGL